MWTGDEWLDLSSELINDEVEDVLFWAPMMAPPDLTTTFDQLGV